MTEDEAKKKWCPFSRAIDFAVDENGDNHYATTNRNYLGDPNPESYCLASKCMAWRFDRFVEDDNGKLWADGHCGLAGTR